MRKSLVIALMCLVALGSTGCGTFTDLFFGFPGTPFGGVKLDTDSLRSQHMMIRLEGLIDFPLSLVADIVLLPWTATWWALDDEEPAPEKGKDGKKDGDSDEKDGDGEGDQSPDSK